MTLNVRAYKLDHCLQQGGLGASSALETPEHGGRHLLGSR